jgi:hypothetical protein
MGWGSSCNLKMKFILQIRDDLPQLVGMKGLLSLLEYSGNICNCFPKVNCVSSFIFFMSHILDVRFC